MSHPNEETGLWALFSGSGQRQGGEVVEQPEAMPDTRLFAFATEIQEKLSERGWASAVSFGGNVLELRLAKSKFELMGGPKAGLLLVQLNVPNARRVSQELLRVP